MSDDPLEIDCDDEALDRLAIELLGRRCSDLDADEQLVLKRVLAGTFVGCDADETAQLNSTWGDRGIWTRQGDTIHFESDWIQNVAFDAELASDGTLRVHHNFTLDESLPAMVREMKR